MRRLIPAFAAALATLAAAAVLAGCGGNTDTHKDTDGHNPGGSGGHNAADVAFAQMMIPNHQQAVDMAKRAPAQAGNPAVKELAGQIEARQTTEITTMSGWLTSWGEPPVAAPEVAGAGAGGPGIPAEMSGAFMAALASASGTTFDKMFLEMMVRNHEGAIELARTERHDGQFGPATQLAAAVEASHTDEVAAIRRLLDQK
jgi:uncharacterized protein (DUF305 family)